MVERRISQDLTTGRGGFWPRLAPNLVAETELSQKPLGRENLEHRAATAVMSFLYDAALQSVQLLNW